MAQTTIAAYVDPSDKSKSDPFFLKAIWLMSENPFRSYVPVKVPLTN